MSLKYFALAAVSVLLLSGCVDGDDFGGSGGTGGFGGSGGSGSFGGSGGSFDGSNQVSVSRARDICVRAARRQDLNVAGVDYAREYGFFNGAARGVQVGMQIRRDRFSVNTEPRVCRYVYRDGSTDISRT